jgi:hypothetical protein
MPMYELQFRRVGSEFWFSSTRSSSVSELKDYANLQNTDYRIVGPEGPVWQFLAYGRGNIVWIAQRCASPNPAEIYEQCLHLTGIEAICEFLMATAQKGDGFGSGSATLAECRERALIILRDSNAA